MQKFTYSGPKTSFTIGKTDIFLNDGAVVELDETNSYVKRLITHGRLKPIAKPEVPAPIAEAPEEKSTTKNTK